MSNKSLSAALVQVLCECNNPEFDSYGEYVYSVRRSTGYDYNDRLVFSIPPLSSETMFVALKVPNVNETKHLKGTVLVSAVEEDKIETRAPLTILIESLSTIPRILCTRELFNANYGYNVVRLALRRAKKNECKVPFKNTFSG